MRHTLLILASLWLGAVSLRAQTYAPPSYLVSEELLAAVANEFSGSQAKENVRGITQFHRIDASPGFTQAREWVVGRLREIGVSEIEVETFPSDGRIRYGTYVSPLAWTLREGELWIEKPFRERFCRSSELPMCLTTLSRGGEWRGSVIHVGRGTEPEDYESKDVRGKVVLATGYAAQVHREAVIGRGALGVLIYPQAEDRPERPDLVRYNGLWLKAEEKDRAGFGFQLSRRQADRLLEALEGGKSVEVHAQVDAELHPGQLEVTSAFFRGTDPSTSLGAGLSEQEIILIAHLDHPKWSANDNASGSGTLIEIARTLKKLREEKKVSLRRTIRLMWVPEYSGTIAWLEKHRDIGERAIAVLNLDMVGEDLHKTNSRLRITRTPDSLPSFLNDLVENVTAQVAAADLTDPAGSRNLFHYQMTPHDMGSDHDLFNDSTIGVPAIMLGHWPDWTHHSSEDTVDKVDPTTLKRVGVLATATAVWLGTARGEDWTPLGTLAFKKLGGEAALAVLEASSKSASVPSESFAAVQPLHSLYKVLDELAKLAKPTQLHGVERLQQLLYDMEEHVPSVGARSTPSTVPRRLFIGMLEDSYASAWPREQLGERYAWWKEQAEKIPHWEILVYETLNYTDGKRSLAEIEDAVRAEFGEVPEGVVEHILRDLEQIKLVEFLPPKDK